MKKLNNVGAVLVMCATASMAAGQWTPASGEVESISQDAANTIKDQSAQNDVTPRIELRCTPGDLTVTAQIDWGRFISAFSTEVGFKVDDGRFMWLKWKLESNEQVTFSPSSDDSAKLIAAMSSGTTLTVDVSPYSEGPVVVTYDLAGFPAELEALKARCN